MLGVSEILAPLVDGLGVATIEEGCILRVASPSMMNRPNIVVMEGVLYLEELDLVKKHNLILVLHHMHELDLLEQYAQSQETQIQPILVWVQIDIGMHRLGFLPAEIPNLLWRLTLLQKKGVINQQGWMTHFSASEDLFDSANQAQLSCYQEYVAPLVGAKSMANSAAIIQMPQSHQDWIRPGLLLYGASPIYTMPAVNLGFKPIMMLSSLVLAIRFIALGTRIGYNGIWEAKRDSVIATIGIGYGDGYPRHINEGTSVWINQRRFPIVGRVSMDMMMVDITEGEFISIGSKVELWGEHILVEEIAKQANTNPYELLCQVTTRVQINWKN